MLNKCQVDYAVTELVRYYSNNDPLIVASGYKEFVVGCVLPKSIREILTWLNFTHITPPEGLYDETK